MTWEDYIPDLPSSYWTSWFIEWIWFPIVDPTTRWIRLDVAYGYQSWPSTFVKYATNAGPTIYTNVSLVVPGLYGMDSSVWYAYWLMGDDWILYLYAVNGSWGGFMYWTISYDSVRQEVLSYKQDTISKMYFGLESSWGQWSRYLNFQEASQDWALSYMWVANVQELWEEIYNVLSS